MSSRALLVARTDGETTRLRLRDVGLLRTDLRILREGERLAFPLTEIGTVPPSWGEVGVREFAPVEPAGPRDYRDLLDLPGIDRDALPRSFDIVGDVVVIRLPEALLDRRTEIGAALLRFVPSARVVGVDRGVKGTERRRDLERIAGEGGWSTRHRENGLDIDVDLERAYFSPRLAHEHERVAGEVGTGEEILDLCCGVGPFSLAFARDGRAAHVTAVDSNPAAIELLRRSRARYAFGSRLEPRLAALEEFLPDAPPSDRVVLNLPLEGIKYLPSVATAVRPSGRVHYYEVVPRTALERRGSEIVRSLGRPGSWELVERHVVHPYSPRSDLISFTLERAAE